MTDFSISSNINVLVRRLERREVELRASFAKATGDATKTFLAESRKQINEKIYSKPVPNRMESQIERKRGRQAEGKIFKARKSFITKRGNAENSTGKKKAWTRTGKLRRAEKMKIISAYEGIIYNNVVSESKKGNISAYARPRHDMGLPGHRKTRYPAHWRTEAAKITRVKIREIYRNAVIRVFTGG